MTRRGTIAIAVVCVVFVVCRLSVCTITAVIFTRLPSFMVQTKEHLQASNEFANQQPQQNRTRDMDAILDFLLKIHRIKGDWVCVISEKINML